MFLEVAGYAFRGSFEIDIDGRQVRHRFLNEQEQLALNIAVEGWTPENLAIWLDRQVHEMDTHHAELLRWLTDLILYFTSGKGSPRPVGWRVWCIRHCGVGEARLANYSPGRGMPRAAIEADTGVQTIGGAVEENPRSAMSARVAAPCQLIPYAGSRLPPILANAAAINAVTSPKNSV